MITCSGEGNWTGGEHPSCESKFVMFSVQTFKSIRLHILNVQMHARTSAGQTC